MAKKVVCVMVLAVCFAGSASALNLGTINPALGQGSFILDVYGGTFSDNVGINAEWGMGTSPITLGLGISPFLIGEYALRLGYHPDWGIKNFDLYANLTLGIWNMLFIPTILPQLGVHVGGRYFFTRSFAAFAEGGWSLNFNVVKAGIAFKLS